MKKVYTTGPFRVLITGGRDFTDRGVIEKALMDIEQLPDVIIHGDAAGADRLAGQVAEELGLDVWKFPAQWRRFGKSAGPRRNHQMLVEGRPTHVLAFPGGRGTQNMVEQADAAGLPIRFIGAAPMQSPFENLLNVLAEPTVESLD